MIELEDVFNRISRALRSEYGSTLYVVSEKNYNPPKFPCVWVTEIERTPSTAATAIDLSDSQFRSTFEVQAFSNLDVGALKQARGLVNCAMSAFETIGYRMIQGAQVENAEDISIKRYVGRFTRMIGAGDTLPTINT